MKVSRREDFAILLMSALATRKNDEFLSLSTIAGQSGLSPLFLKHIALDLKKKKLIKSREGVGGGYRLARSPEKITVAQILEAVSPDVVKTSCDSDKTCCIDTKSCTCRNLWDTVNTRMRSQLENVKLSDIARS